MFQEAEVVKVVNFLKEKYEETQYDETIIQHINKEEEAPEEKHDTKTMNNGRDILFEEAAIFCIEKDKASASMLQRRFNIGFNRAARIIDQLSDFGVAGSDEGPKPRKIIMSIEQFYEYLNG
jgi:S-DNA-T family DNA segregation ATPase FtsK/SpoIIIE